MTGRDVRQELTTERPERLDSERRRSSWPNQDHLAPGVDEAGGGDQAGQQPRADDDHIRIAPLSDDRSCDP